MELLEHLKMYQKTSLDSEYMAPKDLVSSVSTDSDEPRLLELLFTSSFLLSLITSSFSYFLPAQISQIFA